MLYTIKVLFMLPDCAKTYLCTSVISQIFPGLCLGPQLKRNGEEGKKRGIAKLCCEANATIPIHTHYLVSSDMPISDGCTLVTDPVTTVYSDPIALHQVARYKPAFRQSY